MPPLAMSGTEPRSAAKTSLMRPQRASPTAWPFISFVRPWSVRSDAPAATSRFASAIVGAASVGLRRRILTVTGTGRRVDKCSTMPQTRSGSSSRKAP